MQARERSLHEIRANKFNAKLHGYKLKESEYEQNHRAQTLAREREDVGENQKLASSFFDDRRSMERMQAYEFKLQRALETALREFRQLQKHSRDEAEKRTKNNESDSSRQDECDTRRKIETPDERRITRMLESPNVLVELDQFLASCHAAEQRAEAPDNSPESQNPQAQENPIPQSDPRSSDLDEQRRVASIGCSTPDSDQISDDSCRLVAEKISKTNPM